MKRNRVKSGNNRHSPIILSKSLFSWSLDSIVIFLISVLSMLLPHCPECDKARIFKFVVEFELSGVYVYVNKD